MSRAIVWRYKSGGWVYDLVQDAAKGMGIDAIWANPDVLVEAMGELYHDTQREAFDAACAELRKLGES